MHRILLKGSIPKLFYINKKRPESYETGRYPISLLSLFLNYFFIAINSRSTQFFFDTKQLVVFSHTV